MPGCSRRALTGILLAPLLVRAGAAAEALDLRLQLNPALARLHARDPEAAARVLEELDRIIRGLPPSGPRSQGRNLGFPGQDALLAENPLLQQAFRIDPRAALLQLKEIVALGGR